jgi:hypothetical protein
VPGAGVEQRENQELRGSFLQLAIECPRIHTCHKQIVYRQTTAVNQARTVAGDRACALFGLAD